MPTIFEKAKIGNVELKNRMVMGPMGFTHTNSDGAYSDRQIEYYVERARGGYGLIYPTCTKVSTRFEPLPFPNSLETPHQATRLAMICDKVHQYGSKICAQLSIGLGRVGTFEEGQAHVKAPSATEWFWDPSVICEPYTIDEIHYLVEQFGRSSLLAKNVGADMIEIHAYGGYLIDQFLTPTWNQRQDEYGGSLENRLRILYEIRDAIRNNCGEDYPIIAKLTPTHGFEGGRTLEEGIEMLKVLDNEGFAAFHLDYGSYETWYNAVTTVYQKEGNQLFIAKAAKGAGIKTPLIVQGKIFDPALAERVVASGTAEFIIQGHLALTDPHWPNKVKNGQNEDIRYCIGCNECIHSNLKNRVFTCAVNPLVGMEEDYALSPAKEDVSILVIGGGPAGMVAAITAAKRGYKDVELWEKDTELGGAMLAAATPSFKTDVLRYLKYLKVQLYKSNVKTVLNKEGTVEDILYKKPHVVILAAGSQPIIPNIKGLDQIYAIESTALLKKQAECKGENVVVLGGGLVGCETALDLDQKGKKVTIIEALDDVLKTVDQAPNNDMALRRMLADANIDIRTNSRLIEANKNEVKYESDGETVTLPCDTLVFAVGYKSERNMEDALLGKIEKVFTIGDNVKPAKIIDAVHQGYHTARLLEQLEN